MRQGLDAIHETSILCSTINDQLSTLHLTPANAECFAICFDTTNYPSLTCPLMTRWVSSHFVPKNSMYCSGDMNFISVSKLYSQPDP